MRGLLFGRCCWYDCRLLFEVCVFLFVFAVVVVVFVLSLFACVACRWLRFVLLIVCCLVFLE